MERSKLGKSIIIPIVAVILLVLAGVIFFLNLNPFESSDPHAAHKQLAKDAQQVENVNTSKIPGLNGDRTKRYTVSFSTNPENPEPNEPVTIKFKVYDAATSLPVNLFQTIYEKKMHFIVTNNNLTYFTHIHPEYNDGEFSITTTFPKADMYHLYIQFQPFGAIEQQVGFSLNVGDNKLPPYSKSKPDDNETKTFGEYKVSVDTHGGLKAQDMTNGLQTITFTIKDKNGNPVKNLEPYLASFGHLSMINQKTFEFIHVHPYNLTPPKSNERGGPTVEFLPIGIYGPFKPGIYRAFAEFNPGGKLFNADFTIEVK